VEEEEEEEEEDSTLGIRKNRTFLGDFSNIIRWCRGVVSTRRKRQ
jgi:hypothetical protein